jgi:protein-tyrosine-phosphatase
MRRSLRSRMLSAWSQQPTDRIHPQVVEVTREWDIDLSGYQPKRLTREAAEAATSW